MVRTVTSNKEFQDTISSNQLTVVDFFADWCGPCRMIAPFFEQLAAKYVDVNFIKVNVDETTDVARACGITAMPTFQFFKAGTKVDEVKGANQHALQNAVEKHRVAGAGVASGGFPTTGGQRLGSAADTAPPSVAVPRPETARTSTAPANVPTRVQAKAPARAPAAQESNTGGLVLIILVIILFVVAYMGSSTTALA